MRIPALALLALVLSAPSAYAASAWQEHVYEDQGFAIQFPGTPRIEPGTFTSVRAGDFPATIYEVEFENVVYRMTVVDLSDRAGEGGNFMGEVAYFLMREGEVVFNDFPRVDNAQRGVFGIGMVVDTEDGRRIRSSIYFHRGRLYRADAIVLPARGDKDQAVPSRFEQTLRFNVGG